MNQLAVIQNSASNIMDMLAHQGSTVTQGGPFTAQFQPSVGRPAWQNFAAQVGLQALQTLQSMQFMPYQGNQLQGAGQLLSTVGRMLNSMGNAMQAQAGYQQPVMSQNPQMNQLMQALASILGGGSAQFPQMPQYPQPCGGGVQGPQTYVPTCGGGGVNQTGGGFHPGAGGPMDESRATKVLSNNFDKLSGGSKTFNAQALRNAAADGSNPELQSAAQFALNNPMFMRGLDTAGKGDRPDGKVSKRDLNTSMQTGKLSAGDQSVLDTVGRFANELYRESGRGTLNRGDFAEMARGGRMPNGQPTPPEMQAAAQALLSKPALFDRLDTAEKNGRKADGKISKGDFEVTQSRGRQAGDATGGQWPQNRPQIFVGEPGQGVQILTGRAIEGHLRFTGSSSIANHLMNSLAEHGRTEAAMQMARHTGARVDMQYNVPVA